MLAGCGGNDRREVVNTYLDRVSGAQAGLGTQSAAINQAFHDFSLRANSPAEVRRLVRARAQIVAARRRLLRIRPPSEARRLHGELLRLLGREAAVAGELVWTARYIPRLDRALAPLGPAAAALPRDLKGARRWRQQADAFARYGAALEPVLAALTRLRAPAALRPELVGERGLVRDSIALSGDIARALRHRNAQAAGAKVRALFALTTGKHAAAARQAQRAAARAYNRRIAAIGALQAKIERERQRLERELA